MARPPAVAGAGLTPAEAAARLRAFGPNRLVARERWAAARQLLETLADPMALMLAVAGGVYLALGSVRDGVILLAALVPVLGVDVLLELRSRRALRKLAAAAAPRARVVRGGAEVEVPSADLVPGDLLLLREGDVLPADGRLLAASNLAVDESQLTGEAEPVAKSPGAEGGRFYAGSAVLAGSGTGEVTATGPRTRYGNIAGLIAESAAEPTPLQRKTARLVRGLGVVAGAVAGGVVLLRLLVGARFTEALLAGLGVAMAAIPEEFPLVFAIFLSLGAWRLTGKGVLVRRLVSVETLGATTVICVDKTGTLTRGTFELDALVRLADEERDLLEAAALACELQAQDPLERAILQRCGREPCRAESMRAEWSLAIDHPFDAVGRHMTHVWRRPDGAWVVVAKGALEGILEHCVASPAQRAAAEAANARLARDGARVLAVARAVHDAPGSRREQDERGLQLLGLLGFRDPLRSEVPAAMGECERAGIEVKVITGDHPITAQAVARQAGLGEAKVVTGADLDALSGPERLATIRAARVFARIRPEQKHAVVEALLGAGEVVAMTGDGINDAPALRRASIGVSMGIRGTEVARAAADLVLLRDDFTALVATVREGRRIFDNLVRAFLYLIAFHVPIFGLALLVPLFGLPLLLLPVHLVWLELIVHPVSALLFEAEPAAADVMQRPPRDPRLSLLPRPLLLRSLLTGIALTAAALALYQLRLPAGEPRARSAALAALICGSLLLVFAERALWARWNEVPFPRSARFWTVWLAAIATLPAALYVAPIAEALRVEPLRWGDWLMVLAAAIVSVGWRAFGPRTKASPGRPARFVHPSFEGTSGAGPRERRLS